MFKELSKGSSKASEDEVNKYWSEIDIYNTSVKNREGKENFVFFEGPPTANNLPGVHHVIARDLKDSICKYKAMKGYRVVRKAGWDTHGLPVEIEVEKQLGFNDKNAIEEYGIEAFNKKCKESVWTYKTEWEKMTREMGYFIDMKNPYITFDNNYIETEWWILKRFFDEGLIYEGHKVGPYCPRCGTSLASHEVAQGYQEDEVTSVTIPMKLVNDDAYLLVWTTTPWTLMANLAVCVNPNETYVKVNSREYKFIIAEKLASKVLGDNLEVLETYKGTDLEHMEYEQLMPFIKSDGKAFFVICDEYVTMEDGTGLVHIAPAYGEDDYNVCKKYGIKVVNPVGEDGCYLEGPWKGKFVISCDADVIQWLKENDKLFKKEKIVHNYPHCWRCKTPLLYYAKPSWYIEMTKLKDRLVKNNNTVKWVPDFVGEKRFGNWLSDVKDWSLSRNRYWGTPLNIWKCECGHLESIGSRKELVEKAIEQISEDIELHRPYVDDIHITCPDCGKPMNRVKEVIDCWFDSGAMPFAQYHYPFENKEEFESQFPANYICEGIDQTRGWFYSLLAISTFVKDCAPYKSVLVNDHLQDKLGRKMSKSLGNGVNPFDLFEKYGADAARWYLVYVSPVWTPTKFDEDGMKDVISKFFNTLKNTYTFFQLYANTDNVDPRKYDIKYEDYEEIDKWLLSKYNKLVRDVTNEYENYDLNKVTHLIQDFVCDDLSNWYIRRNRRRFWGSALDNSKKAVYKVTYDVLVGISQLIAPIVPFLSEIIYRNLTDNVSVHCSDFPECDESMIDEHIEERMDLVIDLISMGRYSREEAKIKVRQPLNRIILDGAKENVITDLSNLIKEELNVKEVVFDVNIKDYLSLSIKPNFKVCGKLLGNKMNEFSKVLSNLSEEDINKLKSDEAINVTLDGENYRVDASMVEISSQGKDGFVTAEDHGNVIVLDTTLTEKLISEGIAREIISKVQNIRKNKDFDIADRINILYDGDLVLESVLKEYETFIKEETLTKEFIKKDNLEEEYQLNDIKAFLDVEKNN